MRCRISLNVLFLVGTFTIASAENPENEDMYPEITHFPAVDLVGVGDVNAGETLKISCKARGSNPLTHKWYLNDKLIKVDEKSRCSMDADGSLICGNMQPKRELQIYQCFVSNKYGAVFSRKLKVDVTAITSPFRSGPKGNRDRIHYFINQALIVTCPRHEVHLGANYTWVSTSRDGHLVPLSDSLSYAVTDDGKLVYSAAKKEDLSSAVHCKVSVGSTSYVSHPFEFVHSELSLSSPSNSIPPSLAEKPRKYEMALRGSKKIMKCLPLGYPVPKISWWKDGKPISSGRNNMELQSFDRILVIKNANEKDHEGKYQCGTTGKDKSILEQELATTELFMTGPPQMIEYPPKSLKTFEGKSWTLRCKAKEMYPYYGVLHYEWYKDGKPITSVWRKRVLNNNVLTVEATDTSDSGVYQCVVKGIKGMATAVTKVLVKVVTCKAIASPSNSKFKEDICHMKSSFSPGSRCTVLCDRGFFGKGPKNYRKCLDDGSWSVMQYKCEDREPPIIKKGHECPKPIVIATDQNNDTGRQVTWKPPVAKDNSGKLVTKIEPQGIKGNSHWFPLGLTTVKYTFSDASGKNVSCQFAITVFLRTQIVTKPSSLVYILKNKPLELRCIAKSDSPAFQYTWKRSTPSEPNKMKKIENDTSVQELDGGRRLVISHARDDDGGKYMCEAVNTQYSVQGTRDVTVTSVEIVPAVKWSPWKKWSLCKGKTCGQKGHKTRRRECLKKDTQHVASGCDGESTQIKPCTVLCTTLFRSRTAIPTTNTKESLKEVASFKNMIVKYNAEARGWLKSRFPKLFNYLNTAGGRIVFACAFAGIGISIILVCWSCSLCTKKNVQTIEGEHDQVLVVQDDEDESQQLVDQSTEAAKNKNLQESLEHAEYYGEYYQDGYYIEDYPEFVNSEECAGHYYPEIYYGDDEEMGFVYEQMTG